MEQDLGILLARICLSAVYLYSALDKTINWLNGLNFVYGLRLPQPKFVLIGTIVVQYVGGLAILLGYQTRHGAWLLLAFTVVATVVAHNPVRLRGEEFRRQVTLSLEHLAIVGGLLMLAVVGPGSYSLRP
jgi:putative oxidoreductase